MNNIDFDYRGQQRSNPHILDAHYQQQALTNRGAAILYNYWPSGLGSTAYVPIKGPYSTGSMNHKLQKAKEWLAERKVKT